MTCDWSPIITGGMLVWLLVAMLWNLPGLIAADREGRRMRDDTKRKPICAGGFGGAAYGGGGWVSE